jgi:hypothetical protein
LADLAKGLDLEQLERPAGTGGGGVSFRVVLPVPLWSLQKFLRSEKLLGTPLASRIFCDPKAESFKAIGATFKFDSRAKFSSIHAQTSVAGATWKGFVLGVTGGGTQGDPRQQGGAFVLGGDPVACLWAHYDRHNADQVPIPVLLEAAGAPQSLYVHPRAATRGKGEGEGKG